MAKQPQLHDHKRKRWHAQRATPAPEPPTFGEESTSLPDKKKVRFTVRHGVAAADPRRRSTLGRLSRRCGNCRKSFYPRDARVLCSRCTANPTRFTDPHGAIGIVVRDTVWGIDRRAEFGLPLDTPTARECYLRPRSR